jgi:hypothetical protein
MSPATKDIISKVKQIVPPMLERFHKGKSPRNLTLRRSVLTSRYRPTWPGRRHWRQRRLHWSAILLRHGQCPFGM